MPLFQPGTNVARHRILRLIGSGRVAEVYEVIAPDNRRRALKIIKDDLPLSSKKQARLGQEAEAFASIEHPNVVRFFDAGVDHGRVWILLELVEGVDLRRLADQAGGALPVERAVRIVRQACEGVDAAHQLGILHRDLSPENILVAADDVAKVADFGSAKPTAYGVKTTSEQDVASALCKAPEFARSGVAEARSDVYSMGLVLYEIIAGAHPIAPRSANVMQIVARQLGHEPPPLAALGRDVPGDLSYLVENALAKDPVRRCTMRELADGLAVVLQRLNVQRRAAARSLPLPDREPRLALTEPAMPAFPSGGTMPMAVFTAPAASSHDPPSEAQPAPVAASSTPAGAAPAIAAATGRDALPPPAPSQVPATMRSAWQPPSPPAPAPLPAAANGASTLAERASTSVPVERSAPPPLASTRPRRHVLALALPALALGLAAAGWLLLGRAAITPLAAPPPPAVSASAPPPPAAPSSSAAKRRSPPPPARPRRPAP